MKLIINLNETVKVKLSENGLLLLKRQHDELNERIKESGGQGIPFEIKLDKDGYYELQLWNLLERFGGNNFDFARPAITEIIIETNRSN